MPLARLRLLESADIFSKNIKKYLGFSSGAEYGINSFLESEGIDGKNDIIIAVHAGAGNRLKLWPAEKWAELIDKIAIKNNVKIIITGSKTDSKEVEAVLRLVKNRITDCSSKFNIDEFKALISKIDIFIACDSGPIYIAESFDKYIIDIIGPCDGLEQPPVRPFYEKGTLVFVKNLFCRPCSFVMKAARFCRYGNLKCLEETKVGDVLAVVDDVLVKIKK
jgi:ADP-heptose:LPS heptosyltransferase